MALIGKDIIKAKSILEEGGLVAIPTETVYGLAANAYDVDAVSRIFKAKNRPSFDPLIVHIDGYDRLNEFTEGLSEKAITITQKFWPGPLTLLLKRKPVIADLVTSGLETVAVRMPRHTFTQALLNSLAFPLAAPSANPFGYISPTSAQHVEQQLGDKVDYILDGGECSVGVESTIISFEKSEPTILRLGGVSVEDIEAAIGKVIVNQHSSSQPEAPGMMKSHYAPKKRMMALEEFNQANIGDTIRYGFLGFDKLDERFAKTNQQLLSPKSDLTEAAKNLFGHLRILDQQNDIHTIVASYVPDKGLGRAINDRLKRATVK